MTDSPWSVRGRWKLVVTHSDSPFPTHVYGPYWTKLGAWRGARRILRQKTVLRVDVRKVIG